MLGKIALLGLLVFSSITTAQADSSSAVPPVTVAHGFALNGTLKYSADFKHFEYANPKALKGGEVKLASVGTFDSLNPFIVKGNSVSSPGLMLDTLTTQSEDEPFSEYGLIAETIEIPADKSWVAFNLRKQARFHDGSPITPEDVIFSFNTLRDQGAPFYRAYYGNVSLVEKVGEHKVKFNFDLSQGINPELPLIIGQLPILSEKYWQTREFDKTTLEPFLTSGPYKITALDPGRSVTYERVKDYWAKDLPVNAGQYNYDKIHIDYYKDESVLVQAFKAGEYDFRQENSSKNWATAYAFPALNDGRVIKEEIRHERPTGMQAFVFNTRRPMFQDKRVRHALGYLFDFEWANANLFYGAYARTHSFFSNSELASSGLPSAAELAILKPLQEKYPEHVPPEVFTQTYQAPTTDGTGKIRRHIRQAMRLLTDAGWSIKNGKLVNANGEPMQFEILLVSPFFERIVLPYKKNLERIGIEVSVRTVDSSQYINRVQAFDFDMIVSSFAQSSSPGNEQRDFWSTAKADQVGSRNVIGIKNPAIDELIEMIITAPDRASLITRTHALDRILLWQHYVIPQWHIQYFRVVYWNKFKRPAINPKYALGFYHWWIDPELATQLRTYRGE